MDSKVKDGGRNGCQTSRTKLSHFYHITPSNFLEAEKGGKPKNTSSPRGGNRGHVGGDEGDLLNKVIVSVCSSHTRVQVTYACRYMNSAKQGRSHGAIT